MIENNLSSAFVHKRAKSLAIEGNKKLDQLIRADKMMRILVESFASARADKEEILKALDQIKNILGEEIKISYTAKLSVILKPLEPQKLQEPANETNTPTGT